MTKTITLPTFKGWTVDTRLKEFRRIRKGKMECLPFDGDKYFGKGDILLCQYLKTLDKDSVEYNEIANAIV